MGEAAGVASGADACLLELEAGLARVARVGAVLGLVPRLTAVKAVEGLDRAPGWSKAVESVAWLGHCMQWLGAHWPKLSCASRAAQSRQAHPEEARGARAELGHCQGAHFDQAAARLGVVPQLSAREAGGRLEAAAGGVSRLAKARLVRG